MSDLRSLTQNFVKYRRLAHSRPKEKPHDSQAYREPVVLKRGPGRPPAPPPVATLDEPPTIPNPLLEASEPDMGRMMINMPEPQYRKSEVRRVVEAEIDGLIEWGIDKFRQRYPRCLPEHIRAMLQVASRGGRCALLRTDDAFALFEAETTPWEPELWVYEVFVVSRIVAPMEVMALYRAGEKWARQIGAAGYSFGSSTGIDIKPIAERIGHHWEQHSYAKSLLPEPEAEVEAETVEVAE